MLSVEQGCIDIWIDEIVPCLKDTQTGEIKETVVFKIESCAYLKKFRKSNGWHINWNEIPKNIEVYALALKDDNTIQGLVGIKNDKDSYIFIGHVLRLITISMSMEVKSTLALVGISLL